MRSESPSTPLHDIKTLVRSFHPLLVIETVEEARVQDLLRAVARDLDQALFEWTVTRGLQRAGGQGPAHGTADPMGLLKHLATLTLAGIFHLKDFSAHLSTPALVRAFRDVSQQFTRTRSTLVLSGDPVALPRELAHKAVHVELRFPDEAELREAVASVVQSLAGRPRVEMSLAPADLQAVVRALSGLTLNQARQALAYAVLDEGRLTLDHIPTLTRRKTQMIQEAGLLEYVPVEENRYEIGGFARFRAWLERARAGFTPEARAINLAPPRGVLIVGVQGCGKSLAAKVIGREWKLPLLKLDAGRLYDKYIGESERNLRRALELAESMAPVVLWIDELEKGFAGAGASDGDLGVGRRLAGSFLTWLQERRSEVFVAATANDVFSLPPELLRKGRFDEIFFVDLPDAAEREAIFRIHLTLRRQSADALDLPGLVATADGFSGAEIEQAVVSALYRALHRKTPLDTDLLLEEIGETVPLSRSRREDIERLRETAKGRFVSVAH